MPLPSCFVLVYCNFHATHETWLLPDRLSVLSENHHGLTEVLPVVVRAAGGPSRNERQTGRQGHKKTPSWEAESCTARGSFSNPTVWEITLDQNRKTVNQGRKKKKGALAAEEAPPAPAPAPGPCGRFHSRANVTGQQDQ